MSRLAIFVALLLACMLAFTVAADSPQDDAGDDGDAAVATPHVFHPMVAGNAGPTNTSSRYNFSTSALYPNGSFPSDAEIQRYQIALWTSILLVVIALAAAYSLAFMEFKKDTILYSSFNPNWEERKRR